jgi:methionyl-tRNA formyltransferase
MSDMRFAWVGFHSEGVLALEALLEAKAPIQGVITLKPDLAAKRSGGADYGPLCERFGVPLHYIANINEPDATALLADLACDVVFVIGWHQIVRPAALRLARLGMIGAHASLLPHNRGSAPINWAIIRGERQTGNTLFWLTEDVDAGTIIDQRPFPITPYDTCATLYGHVALTNRDMLLTLLPRLLAGEHPGTRQPPDNEPVLPRRRPADGKIDWGTPGRMVYDFIRALTRPYPGAFSHLDGRRWRIWQAALPQIPAVPDAEPGQCVGPVWSPVDSACGQLVACGDGAPGAVLLLQLEDDDGAILRGRELSDQPWAGKRWTDA